MPLADSPFVHQLNTNFVPSDSEVKQLHALLQEPVAELARLDALISHLVAQKASLQVVVDSHRALLSPIRRIPEDVLREIFISCLPDDHDALIEVTEAPMLLGRICGLWRRVANSTPRLWSSVYIPPLVSGANGIEPPKGMEQRLGMLLQAWFDRSGLCSLSVSLAQPRDQDEVPSVVLAQLLRVSRRLRSFRYEGSGSGLSALLQLGAEQLPMLESILMDGLRGSRWPPPVLDHSNIFCIPALRRLSLQGEVNLLALPIAWAQLTEINSDCVSNHTSLTPDDALEVLHRCTKLVRCRLSQLDPHTGLTFTPRDIHLPHLQALRLDFYYSMDPMDLLECLTMPKLHYLQLGVRAGGEEDNFTSRFFDASVSDGPAADLVVYITGNMHISEAMLRGLIYVFPIAHLRLGEPDSTDIERLQDGFFKIPLSTTTCPPLRKLDIVRNLCDWSDSAILSWIHGRMTTNQPLQRVHIGFDRPMEIDILPELQGYVAQGLDISLSYVPTPVWTFNARARFNIEPFGY
ncbi:hypothetical protein FB45DRAFT_1052660 [Roridomyces roridus]|uniref:F-box domain-containing protein n=1 Tax=Roridomyces roridus TaxID=1738132 RepID=A0AAD7CAJ1_9AGAR|nr:hypothetical protein FB45DRAFT_1052660 [Roridomyces roridus]